MDPDIFIFVTEHMFDENPPEFEHESSSVAYLTMIGIIAAIISRMI